MKSPDGPRRILVLEHDPRRLGFVTEWLDRAGYVTATGLEGLEGSDGPARARPELIIMDFAMPHGESLEMIELLRDDGRFREAPIIVLSYFDDPSHRERGKTLGVAACLRKPCSFREIRDAISRLQSGPPHEVTSCT